MRLSATFLGLLLSVSLLQAQHAEPKPLWGKQLPASSRLLGSSPEGKVIYVLQDKKVDSEKPKKVIHQYQLSDGNELKSYELEEFVTPDFTAGKDGWQQVRFDASPDRQTLLASYEVPYSQTRNNVYGHRHLQLYDLHTGKRKGELIKRVVWLRSGQFCEESGSCYSPDGKWFWAFNVGYGMQFDVYGCDTGKVVYSEKCQPNVRSPLSIAFSEDGKRATIFYQGKDNRYAVSIHSWPDGKKLDDVLLPKEQYWQSVHSWYSNHILIEALVEDERSKEAAGSVPAARPIQVWKRVCHSMDVLADQPLNTLKEEAHIGGFHGRSLGMPMIYWDMGNDWSARMIQHAQSEDVIQAAAGKKETLPYYNWRDIQILDAGSGAVLWQHKNLPWQSQITRNGSHLIAAGASPGFPDGLYVWTLPKRP